MNRVNNGNNKKSWSKVVSIGIVILTFLSLLPIILIHADGYQKTILWFYSFSMAIFLSFMYLSTYAYKPMPDVGYRPMVSIIVPAKNEEKAIRKTIMDILRSNYPMDRLEVIAIDDGSTDGTADEIKKIKSLRLKFIHNEKNLGKKTALAKGFIKSVGEIVMCVDSDSFVKPDAIKLMMQPFTDPKVQAVCGHGEAENRDTNILTKLQHYWYLEMFRLLKGMESVYGCVTCCSGVLAAYRRTAIKKTMDDWYNESLSGKKLVSKESWIMHMVSKSQADDRTLTVIALAPRTAKVVYQSNALVTTLVPDTMKQFIRQQIRWNRAWVHGTLLSSKFMWKKPFPVPLYFYGYQMIITALNPFIVITWLIIKPIQGMWIAAMLFMIGMTYIAILHGLNVYRTDRRIAVIPYRILFGLISIFQSAVLVPYAWLTVWDGSWSTRIDRGSGGVNNYFIRTKNVMNKMAHRKIGIASGANVTSILKSLFMLILMNILILRYWKM